MLKLKKIKKIYDLGSDNKVQALTDINLEFRKSEFVSILGPSGCGKTTLLNIIGGLDKSTDGELIVNNQSTKEFKSQDWDKYRNENLGFVFQSYNLIPHQTILKNVELSLTLTGMKKEERLKHTKEVLEKVGLGDQINKKPNQLSGGQMQRVAIARALVNNPDIILADEPTGALDSESGHQVMNLLKEVAKDRLVIMVTHNEQLAETYSTRIIKLRDGKAIYDSNPYTEETVHKELSKPKKPVKKAKKEKKKKISMSYWTAFSLSINNLLSKKGRSILTSIAGSIGIIGICLVLALSAGVNKYIETIEKDALSLYPLEVSETSMSLSSIFSLLTEEIEERPNHPDTDKVYTKKVLGNVIAKLPDLISRNDLKAFKAHIEENYDESLGYVKYDYSVGFNVYCNYVQDEQNYMKVSPFLDGMEEVLDKIPFLPDNIFNQLEGFAERISVWDEMIDNQEILEQQYELLGSSRWPKEKDEVVVILDKKNQIDDFALLALGLVSEDTIRDIFGGQTEYEFTIQDLMNLEYKLISNADYYYYNDSSDMWMKHHSRKRDLEFVETNGLDVKVVGVIRPKEGAVSTSINGLVGYTSALTEYMMQKAADHPAVLAQQESDTDILTGEKITNKKAKLVEMGVADIDTPSRIRLYAYSFEAKDQIINFIEDYNKTSNKPIKYSDNLSIIMGYVDTFTKTVTGVLIGFSAISLIVSSIMIAIIVYTSVLERRKEIGVVRSLGARKKDVSNVFFAESATLGFFSGVIGVLVTLLLSVPANIILKMMFSFAGLVSMQWWHAVMMIFISFLLSVLAGYIPSRMAAQQDPVKALRTE